MHSTPPSPLPSPATSSRRSRAARGRTATRHPPQLLRRNPPSCKSCPPVKIHPASKIFLPLIPPVAVFATTPASGFVEMILHPLLIQKFIKIKIKKFDD
jgi:hypothetical protein